MGRTSPLPRPQAIVAQLRFGNIGLALNDGDVEPLGVASRAKVARWAAAILSWNQVSRNRAMDGAKMKISASMTKKIVSTRSRADNDLARGGRRESVDAMDVL